MSVLNTHKLGASLPFKNEILHVSLCAAGQISAAWSEKCRKHMHTHTCARTHTAVASHKGDSEKVDIDDGAIPIGVINAQVILEGHGQRCGPFITSGLAYSRPIEPLK